MKSFQPKYYDINGDLIKVGDVVEFQDTKQNSIIGKIKQTAIIGENEFGEMTIKLAVKDLYMNRQRSKTLKIIKEY